MERLNKRYIESELDSLKSIMDRLKCIEQFYQDGDVTLNYPGETLEAMRPLIESAVEDLESEVIKPLEAVFCLDGPNKRMEELEDRQHKIMLLKDAARVFWYEFEDVKLEPVMGPIIQKAKNEFVKEAFNILGFKPNKEEQELIDSSFGLG
jgi:hypothetical protein